MHSDLIKILIIISTLLILTCRHYSKDRFQYLIKFWNIHRYFYSKKGITIHFFNLTNSFFLLLRIMIYSIFLFSYILPKRYYDSEISGFIFIFSLLSSLIIIKFFSEKIISLIFNIKKEINEILRIKIGLKNLIAVHMYFFLMVLLFVPIAKEIVVPTSIIIFSIYCFFTHLHLFKKLNINTNKKLLYFILYLCTFEISPLLFICIVVLKNINI